MRVTPQEIEVWYVLPAIRREITIALKAKYKQREIAEILGVTEAAVSQYIKNKRAKNVEFSDTIKKEIKTSAIRIAEKPKLAFEELQRICRLVEEDATRCRIHKRFDKKVPENCFICRGLR